MPGTTRPRGFLRLFLRFPIVLYRLGLGWLFGDRLLMLTHIGRRSGHPRRVVVEVVQHDLPGNQYVILSGWGERSQWVQNIEKTPGVTLQVGLRKWPAMARRLSPQEAGAALDDYARRRPAAVRVLSQRYGLTPSESETLEQTCLQLAARIPLFALEARTR